MRILRAEKFYNNSDVGETGEALMQNIVHKPKILRKNNKSLLNEINLCDLKNIKTPNKYSKKTIANRTSEVRKIAKTPIKQSQVFFNISKDWSDELKKACVKHFIPDVEEKIYGELYQKVRKDNPKTNDAYKIASACSSVTEGIKVSHIRKNFGISYSKAKKLSYGDE